MEIRRIDGHLPDDAVSVRQAVFVEEQGVPEDRELDGNDDGATHFVAYDRTEPIGTARLRDYDTDVAKAERVAIVADRRGEGLGRELMEAVEATASGAGYDRVVLHAQVSVVPFYRKLGYEPVGEIFKDAGIDHREMWKTL